jgi:antitoxin component of MazEF toxin-antitoxin module
MTKRLQKLGNSKALLLNSTMLAHLGVSEEVEVSLEAGRIVLTAPDRKTVQRQSFEEAMHSTFEQYDTTMQDLAKRP